MRQRALVAFCASALAVVSASHADVYSGPGGDIPDSVSGVPGVVQFSIWIDAPDQTVAQVNSITLKDLTHSWAGDLIVTLTAPDSTTVTLFHRIGVFPPPPSGDSSNFDGDYAFADSGFTYGDGNIWTEAALGGTDYTIRSGTYAASGPGSGDAINLNALLSGLSANGAWVLTISDNASFDTGHLAEWCLDFTLVPAPGAFAALVVAAACRGRRRRA